MFRGDSPALREVTWGAVALARRLGHERVGAEHLLISLAARSGEPAEILAAHGLAVDALTETAEALGPGGAVTAADALVGAVSG